MLDGWMSSGSSGSMPIRPAASSSLMVRSERTMLLTSFPDSAARASRAGRTYSPRYRLSCYAHLL